MLVDSARVQAGSFVPAPLSRFPNEGAITEFVGSTDPLEEITVPTTLLAVDDSVTMRKVFEMTFAGEDFRVVTADSVDAGMAKVRSERPAVVLADVSLDGQAGGYALCSKIKAESPATPVILLASKQQPYEAQKGLTARADDFIEKPFDTQQLIDKVRRVLTKPAAVEPARPQVAPAPAAAPAAPSARVGGTTVPMGGPRPPGFGSPSTGVPAQPPLQPRPTAPGMGQAAAAQAQAGRGTLAYGGLPGGAASPPSPTPSAAPLPQARPAAVPASPVQHSPPLAPPMAAPVAAPPAPTPPAPAPPPPAPPAPAASAPVSPAPIAAPAPEPVAAVGAAMAPNGSLANKLSHLGLSEAQVSAVLALSRDVVEKVVWEVVPVLAETMIKEEIKRLTSE